MNTPCGSGFKRESPYKMLYISHRGNTLGPIPAFENTPDYIVAAIHRGFMVEIDLWGEVDGHFRTLWLGHDRPERPVRPEFLAQYNQSLIYHCKNIHAYTILMSKVLQPIAFFHDRDDYTFTSNGWLWCYPGKPLPLVASGVNSILVLPERFESFDNLPYYPSQYDLSGICSDHIETIASLMKHK